MDCASIVSLAGFLPDVSVKLAGLFLLALFLMFLLC